MQADFWHQKWRDNKIGFHENAPNSLLTNNFAQLNLAKNSRIFIPLCGKTLDIAWLLSKGHYVIGAELSQMAIEQLFEALKLVPQITNLGKLQHYKAENIDIFVGDIFELTSDMIGQIALIYDRAAMVALPQTTRHQYAKHMIKISNNAPQLLICFEYDQNLRNGPPFSVSGAEVKTHYAKHYGISLLEKSTTENALSAVENIWFLKQAAVHQ
ncbi:MAG: thiopurine S-methyltransferase [Alphaproteobacteria bacterium]|nr:thiopurine S-methyltransferase [Alphaproteobacteria bacterium]